MEQESTRLHIEEYALRAAIRQEKLNNQLLKNEKETASPLNVASAAESVKNKETTPILNSQMQPQQNVNNSEVYPVISNITEDGFLEPLVLNPHGSNSGLIEFDD